MDGWIDIDGQPEGELPSYITDGQTGDRASIIDGGVLHVLEGRASFVRWSDVIGVVEHADSAYVMVPRRPPSPPWLLVSEEMVGGGRDRFQRFVERVRDGGHTGGYRDAIQKHRQGLDTATLRERILEHEPVPGAMEVPPTVPLRRSYPDLIVTQFAILAGALFASAIATVTVAAKLGFSEPGMQILLLLVLPVAAGVAGLGARAIGPWWRAHRNATLPRQRVLVLAPDGCMIGFNSGVRTLRWDEIGGFDAEWSGPDDEELLLVFDPEGELIGTLLTSFVAAPTKLVLAVAEHYRQAAR